MTTDGRTTSEPGDWQQRLGATIKGWREAAGIKQAALARAIGVDAANVCRYESGTQRPTLDNLVAIARACGVRQVELLLEGDAPANDNAGVGV